MENIIKIVLILFIVLLVIIWILTLIKIVKPIIIRADRNEIVVMETIDTSIGNMSTQEIEILNFQFEKYLGSNIKGTNLKRLINDINSSNLFYENKIEVNMTIEEVDFNKIYNVSAEYDSNGYISKIIIK